MRANKQNRWRRAEDVLTLATAIALFAIVTVLTIVRWPDFAPGLEKYRRHSAIDRAAVAFVEFKIPIHYQREAVAEK